jgi:hypothetical protein
MVERGLNVLAALLPQDADYGTSESVSQAIIALSALHIDPAQDSRFIKGDKSLIDALLSYRMDDGGFSHVAGDATDAMATEQAVLALVAYVRLLDGARSLYDMADASESDNPWQFEPALDNEDETPDNTGEIPDNTDDSPEAAPAGGFLVAQNPTGIYGLLVLALAAMLALALVKAPILVRRNRID